MPTRPAQRPASILDAVVIEVKRLAGARLSYEMHSQWDRLLHRLPVLQQLSCVPTGSDAAAQV
jgi:hypothetical protein